MARAPQVATALLTVGLLVVPTGAATGAPAEVAPSTVAGSGVRLEAFPLSERHGVPTVGDEDQEYAAAELSVDTFNVAAVTWDASTEGDDSHATTWIRARTDDGWSEWIEVHDDHHAPDPAPAGPVDYRGGTEPFITGDADGIEVRVVSEPGQVLPEGLQLEVIDPGRTATDPDIAALDADALPAQDDPPPTDAPLPAEEDPAPTNDARSTEEDPAPTNDTRSTEEDPAPTNDTRSTEAAPPHDAAEMTVTSTAGWTRGMPVVLPSAPVTEPTVQAGSQSSFAVPPQPTIRTRATWGADETLRRNYGRSVQYGSVRGAFVHHTAGTNTYQRSDVPRIIRGIYHYHVVSRDFYDIGYNFLVDRFGRVWEGAYGGIDRAVVAAHTKYYNSQSFGVSVMGDYTSKTPEPAVLASLMDLIAWKLVNHGVTNARSTANYTNAGAISQPVIAGHRDAKATACPGQLLYDRLGGIRLGTAHRIDSVAGRLTMTGPGLATFGERTELTIAWFTGDMPIDGRVNLQRLEGGRWTHIRQVRVLNGRATTVITPGSSNSYRLRASSASDPVNIDTSHPKGTSNTHSVTVIRASQLPVLTMSGPSGVTWGARTELTIAWRASAGWVTGRVNLQRLEGGRWTHIRQVRVLNGRATTVITPGSSNSYRLRASSVSRPSGVPTSHPQGTSNTLRIIVS